jgi:hypothetical protein
MKKRYSLILSFTDHDAKIATWHKKGCQQDQKQTDAVDADEIFNSVKAHPGHALD